LETLCIFPSREFTVSGLARETDLSKSFVSTKITELAERGLINVDSRGNQKVLSFDRGNESALKLKQLINLDKVYSSSIIDDLVDLYSYPDAIVLFGSFSTGEDTESSDIDIAVITSETHDYENRLMNRPVSVTEFKNEIPENMLESLANGITVYGHLEVSSS